VGVVCVDAAASCVRAGRCGAAALRDHAEQILRAIAKDLRTPQTRVEQSAKSKGQAPVMLKATETAAQTHAVLRATEGFSIRQLVAEYRALRASVLRLWGDAATYGPADLATVCRDEIELLRAALPASTIEFAAAGVTQGSWDASRIKQMLSNLVINAAKYGDPSGIVRVSLRGDDVQVHLSVENTGPSIPKELMYSLFEPLRRHAGADSQGERESLGLGLFIVRQVALAHGGDVTVESGDGTTRFTVTLPKR
jgi:signal transduction histidine kinase